MSQYQNSPTISARLLNNDTDNNPAKTSSLSRSLITQENLPEISKTASSTSETAGNSSSKALANSALKDTAPRGTKQQKSSHKMRALRDMSDYTYMLTEREGGTDGQREGEREERGREGRGKGREREK